ncbi:hypothetical protein ABC399_08335 [Lactiplantibacillus plantarum]|uniref:hypothetical protein n=1 Tax=Lactiplantibacillus plantarum TaxID=1590 RepID=UPI003965D0D4
MVNTILEEADLFCPNSVRINFTIYLFNTHDLSIQEGVRIMRQNLARVLTLF